MDAVLRKKIFTTVMLFALSVGFGIFGFMIIRNERITSGLDYEDTIKKECIYVGYDTHRAYKTGTSYYINVEGEKPFLIDKIASVKINDAALESLNAGDPVTLYVIEEKTDDTDYTVAEMRSGDTVVLSLEDYNAKHGSNSTLGIVIVSVVCAFVFIGGIFSLKSCFVKNKE